MISPPAEKAARRRKPIMGLLLLLVGRTLIASCVFAYFGLVMAGGLNSEDSRVSPFVGFIPTLLLLVVGNAGVACARYGRKLRVRLADEVLAHDPRAPVLYLRSFQHDGVGTVSAGSPLAMYGIALEQNTVEQDLAQAFQDLGPVVAIGNPDEQLPELGAARLYVSHEDWQTKVTELMEAALLVVLRAGESEGFLWELGRAGRVCTPQSVVIYIPFSTETGNTKELALQRQAYAEFRERANQHLPQPLPETIGRSRFIAFDDNWTPVPVPPLTTRQIAMGQSVTGSQAANIRREVGPIIERLLPARHVPAHRRVFGAAIGAVVRALLLILIAVVVLALLMLAAGIFMGYG